MARDHLTRDQARARIDAQLPMADKVAVATHVIDNSGEPAATAAQVARLLEELEWSA
jgi:dephospho-CoA kinase